MNACAPTPTTGPLSGLPENTSGPSLGPGSMSNHDTSMADIAPAIALDPHRDARALVRLLQCALCSHPLRTPVTLPCGNSCCRQCLPPSHVREHITFPAASNRHYGVTCPFPDCQEAHPLQDCSVNVVLLKIMEAVYDQVSKVEIEEDSEELSMKEVIRLPTTLSNSPLEEGPREKGHTYTSRGGRLLATYRFADSGTLHFTSDISYPPEEDTAQSAIVDESLLTHLKEASHKELECHVCYSLMLDPTTTPCGHTFCRKCLARILDHSSLCAICRRELFLPASLSRQPSNKYLMNLLESLCPDQVAARAEAMAIEESHSPGGLDTALFPCSLAFPGLRTYLHIFEPRYRLMIRRAVEGNGHFGMVGYNRYLEPQGLLGRTHFMGVGTMLKVEQLRLLPDGRSFVECVGVNRFRVRAHGQLDGYIIANVEKIEDISLAEEEALEAHETTMPPAADNDLAGQLDRMPTNDLAAISLGFIQRAREQSARWFSSRLLETYGEPPTDPALLPYWLATVLPLVDEEKFKVLPTTSIRDRLKITARWVRRIEMQRWYVDS